MNWVGENMKNSSVFTSLVVVFSCDIVEQNHGFANMIMKHVLKVSYALMLPTT